MESFEVQAEDFATEAFVEELVPEEEAVVATEATEPVEEVTEVINPAPKAKRKRKAKVKVEKTED